MLVVLWAVLIAGKIHRFDVIFMKVFDFSDAAAMVDDGALVTFGFDAGKLKLKLTNQGKLASAGFDANAFL